MTSELQRSVRMKARRHFPPFDGGYGQSMAAPSANIGRLLDCTVGMGIGHPVTMHSMQLPGVIAKSPSSFLVLSQPTVLASLSDGAFDLLTGSERGGAEGSLEPAGAETMIGNDSRAIGGFGAGHDGLRRLVGSGGDPGWWHGWHTAKKR